MSDPTQPITQNTLPLVPPSVDPAAPLAIGMVLKNDYRVTALLTDTPTLRVYRVAMLQPWDKCVKCGATLQPGDQFCEECGAQIEEQTALLQETPAHDPIGAALLADLAAQNETEMKALPTVREVFVGDNSRYAVLPENTGALVRFDSLLSEPGTVLDEADTLRVGVQLARTLAFLHRNGLALGRLTLADLALTAGREVVLADASAVRRSQSAADQADDVQHLGLVLEKMAGLERATRRLDAADNLTPLASELGTVLSDLRSGTLSDAALLAQTLDTLISERATPNPLRARTGYATDPGMVRDHNEDSLLAWDLRLVWDNRPTNIGLYIVADGMGGHEGGEIASGIAINTIAQTLVPMLLDPRLRSGPVATSTIAERVKQAVIQANAAVYEESVRRGNDMGTTLTMAVVIGDRAIVGNVGDSRTYLHRAGTLTRISKDHSLVQRLVDIGQIGADDVYTHPNRNAILRSLGDSAEPDVDTFDVRLEDGDTLFLCSDGQWEMVRDPHMAQIISSHASPPDACDDLIKAANAGGGEDNIAAILVRFSTPIAAARETTAT